MAATELQLYSFNLMCLFPRYVAKRFGGFYLNTNKTFPFVRFLTLKLTITTN